VAAEICPEYDGQPRRGPDQAPRRIWGSWGALPERSARLTPRLLDTGLSNTSPDWGGKSHAGGRTSVKGSGRGGQQQRRGALGEEGDFAVHGNVYGKVQVGPSADPNDQEGGKGRQRCLLLAQAGLSSYLCMLCTMCVSLSGLGVVSTPLHQAGGRCSAHLGLAFQGIVVGGKARLNTKGLYTEIGDSEIARQNMERW
jgi:hypothetical protein